MTFHKLEIDDIIQTQETWGNVWKLQIILMIFIVDDQNQHKMITTKMTNDDQHKMINTRWSRWSPVTTPGQIEARLRQGGILRLHWRNRLHAVQGNTYSWIEQILRTNHKDHLHKTSSNVELQQIGFQFSCCGIVSPSDYRNTRTTRYLDSVQWLASR